MAFVLTEEQQYLQESARKFIRDKSPVEALRKLRDTNDETGFDRGLWKDMAEMGWAGVIIPEEYGGLDFGYVGLGVVMEEAGRMLAATPLFSTVAVSASAINLAGSPSQKEDILSAIAGGERIVTLAVDEGVRHNPAGVTMTAEKSGDGYTLTGEKTFVLDGHVADQFIVAARTSGASGDTDGVTLFTVDGEAQGVTRERRIMVDSHNAATLTLNGVPVSADAVVGDVDKGFPVLDKVLDIGRICIAAEMLGGVQEAFERTIEYLKTREQFGVPIGSFQALKHRAALMFCEVELAKSIVRAALSALDDGTEDIPLLASLAKAHLCDTFQLVSAEGIQMHGGIGMTDEHEIGFYLKRAKVAQHTFGNAAFHRDRYASLEGY